MIYINQALTDKAISLFMPYIKMSNQGLRALLIDPTMVACYK